MELLSTGYPDGSISSNSYWRSYAVLTSLDLLSIYYLCHCSRFLNAPKLFTLISSNLGKGSSWMLNPSIAWILVDRITTKASLLRAKSPIVTRVYIYTNICELLPLFPENRPMLLSLNHIRLLRGQISILIVLLFFFLIRILDIHRLNLWIMSLYQGLWDCIIIVSTEFLKLFLEVCASIICSH